MASMIWLRTRERSGCGWRRTVWRTLREAYVQQWIFFGGYDDDNDNNQYDLFLWSFFMECHRVADGGISYNKIIDISYLARIHLNLVSSWNSMIFPISRGNIRRKKERKIFELMAGLQPNKKTQLNKIEKENTNWWSHEMVLIVILDITHDCVKFSIRTEPASELWLKLS